MKKNAVIFYLVNLDKTKTNSKLKVLIISHLVFLFGFSNFPSPFGGYKVCVNKIDYIHRREKNA